MVHLINYPCQESRSPFHASAKFSLKKPQGHPVAILIIFLHRATESQPETQNASNIKWTIYYDMPNCINSHQDSKLGHSNVIHYVAH